MSEQKAGKAGNERAKSGKSGQTRIASINSLVNLIWQKRCD